MKKLVRVFLLFVVLLLGLCLAAKPGGATVIFSMPSGTTYAMPNINYNGPGPQTFGPGIVWTSTNAVNGGGSVFGWTVDYYPYSANGIDNGLWLLPLGQPMAGLNDNYAAYGVTDTMTFTFPTPVSTVAGFINYAPGGPTPTTIAVYDPTNKLIESYPLTFLTGGGLNTGRWLGFVEPTANIKYFTLTDNNIGLTALTTATIPVPPTVLLLGSGLAGLLGLPRFRKG